MGRETKVFRLNGNYFPGKIRLVPSRKAGGVVMEERVGIKSAVRSEEYRNLAAPYDWAIPG